MVDNENQWEDMEYSDDETELGDYSEEEMNNEAYSDEEYSDEEYSSYEDEEYDSDETTYPKKGNPLGCIVLLLLLLIIVGALVFVFLPKKGATTSSEPANNNQSGIEIPTGEGATDTTAVGDAFFNEASSDGAEMMTVDFSSNGETTVTTNDNNGEIVATVIDVPAEETAPITVSQADDEVEGLFQKEVPSVEDASQGTNEIMVAYNKIKRENPFKPTVVEGQDDDYASIGGTEFEIIEPPTTSIEDENLTRLLQTQISGILFDDESPSAIVNLNGVDQFVKIGDTISGYTIENITKDKVQISYKNNTYVASVGELFTRGYLEKQRAVADLENKFAGRYRNNN